MPCDAELMKRALMQSVLFFLFFFFFFSHAFNNTLMGMGSNLFHAPCVCYISYRCYQAAKKNPFFFFFFTFWSIWWLVKLNVIKGSISSNIIVCLVCNVRKCTCVPRETSEPPVNLNSLVSPQCLSEETLDPCLSKECPVKTDQIGWSHRMIWACARLTILEVCFVRFQFILL